MDFRDAVKYLRSELGLTQVELATALRINTVTVGRWENGKSLPNRALSASLLDCASSRGASERCLETLKRAISTAAKEKLEFNTEALYAVEHASLRQLIDNADFPIYVCEADSFDLLYLNRRAAAMVGSDEDCIGKKCHKCIMHSDKPCEYCHREALTEEEFKSYDVCRPYDGLLCRMQGKLIQWNGRPAIVKYVLERARLSEDVALLSSPQTELEKGLTLKGLQKEDADKRLEAPLRSIFEGINGGMSAVTLDENGKVINAYANDRYYELIGYTKQQFLSELGEPYKVVHPDDLDRLMKTISVVKETRQPASFRFRVIRRDKRIAYILCSSSMSSVEGLGDRVLISLVTDDTATVETERSASITSKRLEAIMDSINCAVTAASVDDDGTVNKLFTNSLFYEMHGYTKEQYAEEVKSPFDLLHPEDADEMTRIATSLHKPGESKELQYRVITRDGKIKWISAKISIVNFPDAEKPVQLTIFTDISDVMEAARKLSVQQQQFNEMLRIAAETDQRSMIIYDVVKNSCRVESKALYSAKYGEYFENVPESLLERGVVAPDSFEELSGLFQRLRSGEKNVTVSLQLRSGPQSYEWFRCTATLMLTDEGKPSHAVLVFQNITEQRIKEAVYRKWQHSIDTRPPESYTLFRCNLSKSAALDQRNGRLLKIDFPDETLTFNERTRLYVEKYVCAEDQAAYTKLLKTETLLAMYYRSENSAVLEYRETGEDGQEQWRRLTVELVEYLNSKDVQAFLMYEDIDEAKKAEIEARESAETDPLTGAYTRMGFADRVDAVIAGDEKAQHALIMLDMNGFKQLNTAFGHAAGDEALQEVAAVIRSFTRKGDMVCRLGGDEFLVFLKSIPYDAVIAKTAQQMCEHIRKEYSLEVLISASAGIAVYPRDGENYEELYPNADKALHRVKESKKGGIAFFSASEEQESEEINAALSAVKQREHILRGAKRRILIADDDESIRALLKDAFKDEYQVELAKNGAEAMARLRHFGVSLSVVLLDLTMPVTDGFTVLKRMQSDVELRTVPVIVVTGDLEHGTLLKAIELGAAEYVTKPVDMGLLRMRIRSVISKAENERLRAQNSYLTLQRDEEIKYRTVLESTGTVVVEYDWRNHLFIYDPSISQYIAGSFDHRSLWQILLSDMVADSSSVKDLQNKLFALANERGAKRDSSIIMLKTPAGAKHFFRISIYKRADEFGLAEKLIMTFNDVHEEVLANEKLLFQATRDELTGLYNRAGFIEAATEMIRGKPAGHYMISCLDIEKFKVINDQFGTKKGDEILRKIASLIERTFQEDGLCSRITADNFAILFPLTLLDSPQLEELHRSAVAIDKDVPNVRFAVGRCFVDDLSLDVSSLYDRAAIAKNTVKGRYDDYIATFDSSMRSEILRQQEVTSQMNRALENHEFEVWLQPQYNHVNGLLSGAEALVRWRHPEKGIVPPMEFIPIFERNGFIYELDKYVWEQTCILLRKWLDMGLKCVPVSVNVSRYDIFRGDLMGSIEALIAKYELPRELLCLEITESAFSKNSDRIIKVVQTLVDAGYTVEIDDFGSGYSSLNTLKDVPAQVLKMDMRFLENDKNAQRGGSIIESVVRMAKWLGMKIIAEGVETLEQADYLKSIGCEYIQGYLYSRPAQVTEYEKLFEEGRVDAAFALPSPVNTWNNNAFWNPASMETLIFNSYVGGACIFEYHKGKTELLRYNSNYADIFSGSFHFVRDETLNDIFAVLDKKNTDRFGKCIGEAIATKKEAECQIKFVDDNGKRLFVRAVLRQIAQAGERYLFYCVVADITQQRLAEKKQLESARRLEIVMANVRGGVSAIIINEDGSSSIVFSNERYYELYGYSRAEAEEERIDVMTLIVPEERDAVLEKIKKLKAEAVPTVIDYQIRRKDGKRALLQANASLMNLDGYGDVIVSVITDITKQRLLEDQLRALVGNINGGLSASYVKNGVPYFAVINDQFFTMHGFKSREEYETYCGDDKFTPIHPEDRERVRAQFLSADHGKSQYTMEYRIVRKDGVVRSVHNETRVISLFGIEEPVQMSIITDISEVTEAYEQLRFLNNSAHDILAQPDSDKAIAKTLEDVLTYFVGQRAYIFEIDDDAQTSSNSYEVCAPNVPPLMEEMQDLSLEQMRIWVDAFHRDGFVVMDDVSKLDNDNELLREFLAEQGVRSIILVPLWRSKALVGYMGIDNPTKTVGRMERLLAVADFVTMLLTRRDLMRKIEQDNEMALQLMNDTPGAFVRMKLDKDGNFLPIFSNDGFSRMVGISHEKLHEMYGDNVLGGVHPEDYGIVLSAGQRMMADGAAESARFRVINGKGEYMWISMYGRVSKDETGDVFMNVYYTDVSREVSREQTQKNLLDNLPCGAALYEFDGSKLSVVHINKSYWQLVGRDAVDYSMAETIMGAIHPDDRDITLREIASAVEQGRNALVNLRIIDGKGDYRPFRVESKIVSERNGKFLLFASYTAISQSAMSLQEMFPVALSTMMSSSEDYSLVKDRFMRYVCCSRSYARLLGLDDEREIRGKTDEELFDEHYARLFNAQDRRILSGGEPYIDMVEKVKMGSGEMVTVNTCKYPIRDASGQVVGIYCVCRDITAQREAESQLKLLTDSIPGGLASYVCTENDIRVTYFNSGCRRLFGLPEEGNIDIQLLSPLKYVFDEDRHILDEQFSQLVESGKPMDCIYRVRLGSNTFKWIHHKAVLSDRHGDIVLVNAALFDITEQQEEREQLRIAEEEYRIAMRQGGRSFAHYDVVSKTLKLSGETAEKLDIDDVINDVPYSQVVNGIISDSTAEAYIAFYKKIIGGEKVCSTTFQKLVNREWRWYTVHATTLFGDDGRAVSAVLSYEDVTEQQEKEAVYGKWQQSLKERGEESYTLFRCNLSKNTSFDSWEGKLLKIEFNDTSGSFDERTREYVSRFVLPADRESYASFLSADSLLVEYHRNKRSKTLEYRESCGEGEYRWLRLTIDLVEYPGSRDVEAYLMYENIDEEKRRELLVIERAETDPLTGILNRATFISRVEDILAGSRSGEMHALLMLDIDDFKQINDTLGHAAGDRVLTELTDKISSMLRRGDLIGRLGGDEFFVFMKSIPNRQAAAGKAKQICALRIAPDDNGSTITASIGIAVSPKDGTSFDTLYKSADVALYRQKNNGKNGYVFAENE